MKKQFLIITAIFSTTLFVACGGGETNEKETKTDSTATTVDTVSADTIYTINPELEKFIGLFKDTSVFPFKIDSAYISTIHSDDTLIGTHVKVLMAKMSEHNLTSESSWDLETFFKIDSLKANKKYGEYVESLDIGMMKHSQIYPGHKLKLNPTTFLLTWQLVYGTYEACPYASGTTIFGTLVYKGEVVESFYLAEDMAAGDPPVGMEKTVHAIVAPDGTIDIKSFEIHDEDMDAPKVEHKKAAYTFQVTDSTLKLVTEKMEKPKMVKRKS